MNLTKTSIFKKYFDLGIWGLKTSFGKLGSKTLNKPYFQNPCSNCQKNPHFIQNYNLNLIKFSNPKKYLNLRVWGLKTSFGPPGPKALIRP